MSITMQQMTEINPHADWDDGRGGYCYYRFDAALSDGPTFLRAELTWADDSEDPKFDDSPDDEVWPQVLFRDPQLKLETNSLIGSDMVTYDCVIVNLSDDEAIAIAEADPADLLVKYAEQINQLRVPIHD